MTIRALWLAALLAAFAVAGCANLSGYNVPPSATPSGTATATPGSTASPAPCNTATPSTNANVVYVGMSFAIAPTADPTFGPLAGFGDASSGTIPQFAGPIEVSVGDVVEFVNVEAIGDSEIFHDAVSFGNVTSFPAQPYPFASPAAAGSAITSSAWSSGQIESFDADQNECLSQPFSVPAVGAYLFGDYDTYNSTSSLRGVIVATAASASARSRRPFRVPGRAAWSMRR
jgi:hypothetical protein